MVVVDTNVLAYLLIAGDHTKEAQALFEREPEWKSDAFILIEFSNILATYVRGGRLGRARATGLLSEAEVLMHGLVNVPHMTALRTAEIQGVSAYDARFLAAAQNLGARLTTEDARLRAAAPALTQSLSEALHR